MVLAALGPLLTPPSNGHRACVQLLLAHKAEVDAHDANARGADKSGDTALKLAEDEGHRASASLLEAVDGD